MKKHSLLDWGVHKESISIAVAEAGRTGEVREEASVGGSLVALERTLRKLKQPGVELHYVYEAGLESADPAEQPHGVLERGIRAVRVQTERRRQAAMI
ncbi:MAG TPA: hypothetical protein VF345_06590 [Chthoniobacterales bacterium]